MRVIFSVCVEEYTDLGDLSCMSVGLRGGERGVGGKLGLLWAGKLYVGQGSYNADGEQFKDVQLDLGLQIQDCASTRVQLASC